MRSGNIIQEGTQIKVDSVPSKERTDLEINLLISEALR